MLDRKHLHRISSVWMGEWGKLYKNALGTQLSNQPFTPISNLANIYMGGGLERTHPGTERQCKLHTGGPQLARTTAKETFLCGVFMFAWLLSGYPDFLPHTKDVFGSFVILNWPHVGVNDCLSLCDSPATGWRPVQGVRRLSSNHSWDKPQSPCDPDKWLEDGWMCW